PSAVASGRCKCSEVPGQHRSRWNKLPCVCRILAEDRPLIASKKEQLVLDDWSAERPAKLISLQSAAFRRKVWPGIEEVMAEKVEEIPVKLIRARFRYRTHLRGTTLLGSDSTKLRFEFRQRVRKWKRQSNAIVRIHMTNSVQRVLGCRTQCTCGRDGD